MEWDGASPVQLLLTNLLWEQHKLFLPPMNNEQYSDANVPNTFCSLSKADPY